MPYGIANKNGQVYHKEISAILDLAWDNGIDTLDTAKAYGQSEQSIGNYLKNKTGNRWKIITKLSDSVDSIYDQIQDSTQKLTLLPSAILAHSSKLFLKKEFQLELTLASEKQLISKAGVSLYNENEINKVINSFYKPEVIQLPMNILDTRLFRNGVLFQLFEKGIEIHVRSAFLQGLFYIEETKLKNYFNDVVPYIRILRSLAQENGVTLAELSLLWLVSLEEVSKVVIGIDNVNQLEQHLETLEKNVDPTVFEEILSINYENEKILNPSLWPSIF
tara:strand:- start:5266 stop:6096 length:831 start_codon:yes stop_codon:yes gene_type:complete